MALNGAGRATDKLVADNNRATLSELHPSHDVNSN